MLDLIHSLTHAHRLATKPGVGAMRLCRRRLSSRVDVEVLPEGVSDPIWVHDVTPAEVSRLAGAVTATHLRDLAAEMASAREVA